jgi:hypothetical protein
MSRPATQESQKTGSLGLFAGATRAADHQHARHYESGNKQYSRNGYHVWLASFP